ncbi:MAG: SH3 domain-containing protein, partial [Candidatus Aminicenantes bacterium]
MKNGFVKSLLSLLLMLALSQPVWGERVYSIVPWLNVRKLPSTQSKIIHRLRHGRWVDVLEKNSEWLHIQMANGKKGYVYSKLTTDYRLKVLKDERKLILLKGDTRVSEYPIALGFNPRDDKIKLGDGCTPEGRFYICQIINNPEPSETYGPVSLRISYPTIEDARR